MGGDGLFAKNAAGETARIPCPKVTVANATGGGDAMAAALAACMLRVQGIPTRLMVGYAGRMNHAWNMVLINGEEVLYDPTIELNAVESGQTYTVERYY